MAKTISNHPFLKLDLAGRVETLAAHSTSQIEPTGTLVTLQGLMAHFDAGRSTMLVAVNAAIASGRLVRVHKTRDKPFHYVLAKNTGKGDSGLHTMNNTGPADQE